MVATALLRTGVKPQRVYRKEGAGKRAVEIWTTTCIVTNFGKTIAGRASNSNCSVLVNPSNPELSGVAKFPYFPRGGPVPKQGPNVSAHHIMGHVSTWGGMEVGEGMLFPVSVVDGLVHLHGGWKVTAECSWKRLAMRRHGGDACPIGTAVETSAGNDKLADHYDRIIHTTPPFYKHDDNPEEMLAKCYESALAKAISGQNGVRVAVPLLGAGARGFPSDVAIHVASTACWKWCNEGHSGRSGDSKEEVVAFGLLEANLADQLAISFENLSQQ